MYKTFPTLKFIAAVFKIFAISEKLQLKNIS